jgi:hypothetical protein
MSKTRMAGKIFNFLKDSAGGKSSDVVMRLLPDAAFGVLAASQTPGDIGDKLIAGTGSALGGGLGGLVTSGAFRHLTPRDLRAIGMRAGDQLIRAKDLLSGGTGQTGFEKLGAEQQALLAAQLEEQILRQYGLLPGTREQYADPTTGYGVA